MDEVAVCLGTPADAGDSGLEQVALKEDVARAIGSACSQVDAALSTKYVIPLKKINECGEVRYSTPIPGIVARLAAAIVGIRHAPQDPGAVRSRELWATAKLDELAQDAVYLWGQSRKRSRFERSSLAAPKFSQQVWSCAECGLRTLMRAEAPASRLNPAKEEGGPCPKAEEHDWRFDCNL